MFELVHFPFLTGDVLEYKKQKLIVISRTVDVLGKALVEKAGK